MRDAHNYLLQKRDALLSALSLFWLPSGMSSADVLAAYQFKGVSSESVALKDMSGNGRTLTKGSQTYSGTTYTPSWSSSDGFTFDAVYGGNSGYLDNSTLDGQNIQCAIVRFSGLSQTNRGCLVTAGGSSGCAQLMASCTYFTDTVVNRSGAGYVQTWGVYSSGTPLGHWRYTTTTMTSGVLGANFGTSDGLYSNGTKVTATDSGSANTYLGSNTSEITQSYTFGNTHASISDLNNAIWAGKKIIAAAFYSRALSASEHKEVAERMAQL